METHMIFETHAHYDDEAFEQDREALLNSMEAHGIGHIVNACASIESLKATEELMEKYHAQLDYYGRALEQITGKKVKEKVLYSFTLGEACSLS